MVRQSPLDLLPMWGVFVANAAIVMLAIEAGFRIGKHRRRHSLQEDRAPLGEMVTSTLALLAFLLAFTFGMAASRYDARRELVVTESNAIGTAYLRAGLLAEPHRSTVRDLLREYVDLRVVGAQNGNLNQRIRRCEELHDLLWLQAVAVGEKGPGSTVVPLFIGALNEVIDIHARRLALALRNRIPEAIWAALYAVTILGVSVMGYHAGLSSPGRSLAIFALILAFSVVITVIADLDRPQEGFLQVSQQSMIDLQKKVGRPGS